MITKLAKMVTSGKDNERRDYGCEYAKYHKLPYQRANRSDRNKARRTLGIEVGDPREVDHKVPISRGGSNDKKNLQAISRFKNRSKFTS